ncbi:PMS1 protein-like protein 1 [Neofusicoccum parvum]|uniref:PMS1 protein-like protein 1 n=1 Tax=Neofusicoccum parvum TaxID=310453 RepID=A0ACB5RPC3_9PEZI|nr:PMS1 protein-like protein 1 [Neofusicoccum parvum]
MSTSASPPLPTALPAQPSIHALPNPAIRALSSSLALADPCAAVKELVDNALDAGATSVAVDLAPNTLDHLAVRDNGRSVAPADRALLGRRHCTSKLAAPDELRVVGARSLGFRGEALASLAGCAEALWATVRCEGEGMGRVLRVGRAGEGVVGEEARGCPVGTTVRAEGLFAGLPVRRQAALKHAEREVKRVRRMLQAYALARPGVRLELKGGRGRGGWLYAPKPGLGQSGGKERVADAAWKVVGKDATAQYEYAVHEVGGYAIEAFLPRSDAQAKKISGHGQFLSVDARPVSTTRGTLKLVAKAFRERLKKANPALEDVKEPFLRMDVKCPPGSYDPNVEPAKDDVVFEDANAVLTAVEELLDIFYSSHPAAAKSSEEARPVVGSEVRVDEDDIDAESDIFDQLINMPDSGIIPTQNLETPPDEAQKDTLGPETPSIAAGSDVAHSETREEGHGDEPPRPKRRRTWKYNMYDYDEDDFLIGDDGPQSAPEENLAEETEEALNDVNLSNPWTMAKMNARVRDTDVSNNGQTAGLAMQRAERFISHTWPQFIRNPDC